MWKKTRFISNMISISCKLVYKCAVIWQRSAHCNSIMQHILHSWSTASELSKTTKPNPRLLPVTLSVMTDAVWTCPYLEKYSLRCSSVVSWPMPPTKTFLTVSRCSVLLISWRQKKQTTARASLQCYYLLLLLYHLSWFGIGCTSEVILYWTQLLLGWLTT